jgi:ABC-type sugar transport system permease subunit
LLQPPKFVGLSNYQLMLQDDLFWKSLTVTLYYTLVSVPLSLIISFAVALLMNVNVRGIAVFRTLFYLPSIVPAVASAVLWVWVFNSEFGLLNFLLRAGSDYGDAGADHHEPVEHWWHNGDLSRRLAGYSAASLRSG